MRSGAGFITFAVTTKPFNKTGMKKFIEFTTTDKERINLFIDHVVAIKEAKDSHAIVYLASAACPCVELLESYDVVMDWFGPSAN